MSPPAPRLDEAAPATAPQRHARSPVRDRAVRLTGLGVAVAAGWVATWALATALDPSVLDPGWRTALGVGVPALAAAAGAGAVLLARRRPGLAADGCVVLVAVLLAGLSTLALWGTQWGWYALYADSSFRTQMATQYAESLGLPDYGYRGLPAYYPPLLPWIEGRVAAATGTEGWQAVRPVQVAVAALVPLLSYGLWRRVVPAGQAAAAVVVLGLAAAHPQKPDEWLVLACLVPWWLMVVRDIHAPGVTRWPAWVEGCVVGLLLLTHTYFFLPFAVSTALAVAVDAVARRPQRLRLRRGVVVGLVGLAVSSPYWAAVTIARIRLPSDDLQMRYSYLGGNEPPWPSPSALPGLVGCLGLAWLVVAAVRWRLRGEGDRLAGGLALALAGSCLTMVGGDVAARYDIGLLAFKTGHLVEALWLVAGSVAGVRLGSLLLGRVAGPGTGPPARIRTGALTAACAVTAAVGIAAAATEFVDRWVTGRPSAIALTTRYPDGRVPAAAEGQDPPSMPLFTRPDDPPAAALLRAWESIDPEPDRGGPVLVTSRVELLATAPVHGFVAYKSIYSHPNGQFEDRLALLREVAACESPQCAATLLQANPYDRVDGLVLEHSDETTDELVLRLMVDDFPHRTRPEHVTFPAGVLAAPCFEHRDVGRLAVVALLPAACPPDATGTREDQPRADR